MVVKNRDTGIKTLGSVPWSSHICLLYDTPEDLLTALIRYILSGLKNDEVCIWITSKTTGVKKAGEIARGNIPGFSGSSRKNQLEIISFSDVLTRDGKLDMNLFHETMKGRLKQASDSGYDGLRVALDFSEVKKRQWKKIIEYVFVLTKANVKPHILAFYAYPLEKCGVKEFIDLMGDNKYTLIVNNGHFTRLGGRSYRRSSDSKSKIQKRYRSTIQKLKKELRESQEKYSKALRVIQGAVLITTYKDGRFVEVDDNFCQISGYSREELIGHRAYEYRMWPVLKNRPEFVEEITRKRHVSHGKTTIRTKSGNIRPINCTSELINISGKQCIISYIIDVIDYNEEKVREKTIISTAMDGFWIRDLEGNFLEVNESYCQMTGYTREELLKMSISDIEAKENTEDIAEHIWKVLLNGSDHFKTQHKRKDGRIIDIEVNVNYYDVGGGQLFVFIHDLSKEKEVEDSSDKRVKTSWRKDMTRLQEKFVREGFQNFNDREIIELLLSLVLPERQARRLAMKCIDTFKSLGAFLEASPEELTRIGLSPACVFCVAMLHRLPIKVLQEKIREKSIYESPQDVFDYLYYSMRDLKKEVCKAIHLNAKYQIINIFDLFEGTTNRIAIRARDVIESAIKNKTRYLIFVHNHPSGDPTPGQTDKQLTRDLVYIGNILQIRVLDHIIIGDNRYFSFAQEKLIEEYDTDFMNLKLAGTVEAKRRRSGARLPFVYGIINTLFVGGVVNLLLLN